MKKGKKGEAAVFEASEEGASGPFDAAAIAEAAGLYWIQHGGDKFVVKIGDEQWSVMNENKVVMMLKDRKKFGFINPKPREGEGMSQLQQVLWHVMTERMVHGLMEGLAGYDAGKYEFPGGERIIVGRSPHPVEPVEGEWPVVLAFIEGLLNLKLDDPKEVDQTVYFHAWMKGVLYSLLCGTPGNWTQRMLLVLAGPANCGKSRLQHLVSWMLGDRVANPKNYLTGQDAFNANLVRAEHWMMEELENVSKKMEDRLRFSEGLKAMVANSSFVARLMRTDPTTISPFVVGTLSLNSDPDKMLSFPPLTPDLTEKLLMLQVRQAELPMPTETDEEKAAFNKTLREQLPAYAHWLLKEFSVPKELLTYANGKKVRYGVRDFQHPGLTAQMYDVSPSAELLRMITEAEFFVENAAGRGKHPNKFWDLLAPWNRFDAEARDAERIAKNLPCLGQKGWEGSAVDLERLLLGEVDGWHSSEAREAKKFVAHHSVARELGRLSEDWPDRVIRARTKMARFWTILPPSEA